MAAKPVEWVLVIYYGASAHRATYGRFEEEGDKRYTKDYIQLSQRPEFLEVLNRLFPSTLRKEKTPLTYRWPQGRAAGDFDWSSDRWHLKWPIREAPPPWKMLLDPKETTA